MAYAVGLWFRNSYFGFLVIVVFNGALFLLPFYTPFHIFNFTISQSPLWLVMMRSQWFTDGGANALWPHFETVGVIGSLAVLAVISLWSVSRFSMRNLV